MAEHRKTQPRPIKKLYGTKGPSPEQLADYKAYAKRWNSEYRRLGKLQKEALAKESAEYDRLRTEAAAIIQQLEPLLK